MSEEAFGDSRFVTNAVRGWLGWAEGRHRGRSVGHPGGDCRDNACNYGSSNKTQAWGKRVRRVVGEVSADGDWTGALTALVFASTSRRAG